MPTTSVVFFLFSMQFFCMDFFIQGQQQMHLTLIKNADTSATLSYQVARTVYAQTGASSLSLVEAMTSMIKNISEKTGLTISDIIRDKNIFDVLDEKSEHHERIFVAANNRGFEMCLRTARRMLANGLADRCFGATRFHSADIIPQWALSRGYIADIDGFLFYL